MRQKKTLENCEVFSMLIQNEEVFYLINRKPKISIAMMNSVKILGKQFLETSILHFQIITFIRIYVKMEQFFLTKSATLFQAFSLDLWNTHTR